MYLPYKDKVFKFDKKQNEERSLSPHQGVKQSYSEYLTINARAHKYLSPHQK